MAACLYLASLIGKRRVEPSEWINHRIEGKRMAITVNGVEVSHEQECAVLAGLRHLAAGLESGGVFADDGGIGDILTEIRRDHGGKHQSRKVHRRGRM